MRTVLACLVLAALASSARAEGTLTYDVEFYSDALGEMRTVSIYTPEGYDETTRRYPVVYFLHGCMCGAYDPHWAYWTYFGLKDSLDTGIADRTIQPAIVVLPDACGAVFCGSYYTNTELHGDFEDYITQDLVAYVDGSYRTIDRRNYRLLMGHSMGGYGAIRYALRHPDLYGGVAAHAGPLDLLYGLEVSWETVRGEVDPLNEGPPYEYHPEDGPMTGVIFSRAGGFSPNLDNEPYPVDFPYDETGGIVEAVRDRWHEHDPPHLAALMIEEGRTPPCIWFDCGTADEYQAYPVNASFADSLEALGVPCVFETHSGSHNNLRLSASLLYLLDYDADFGCAIVGVEDGGPGPGVTMRVLPNPSRSNSTFAFDLPQAETVTLIVYDISGRAVRSVFDGQLAAGPHSLTWDGKSDAGSPLAEGVYFVALQTGTGTEVMRTVRLK